MLSEIVELTRFAGDVITNSLPSHTKVWRNIYFLYCKLQMVLVTSNTLVSHYFPKPLDEPYLLSTKSFDTPLAKWIYITNQDFSKVTGAVHDFVGELRNVLVNIWMDVHDNNLKLRTQCHLSYKWYWVSFFQNNYAAGEVDANGLVLRRKLVYVIKGDHSQLRQLSELADVIEQKNLVVGLSEFQSWLNNNITREETLDVSTLAKRLQLSEIGQKNLEQLKIEEQRLAEFVRQNCHIDYLL